MYSHRKYHRQSTYTPDQLAILHYLQQRGYDLTIKTFQHQIQSRLQHLLVEWQGFCCKGVSQELFQDWLSRLRDCWGRNYVRRDPKADAEWLGLQFMILVWYCTVGTSKQPNKQSLQVLKDHIQEHGTKLSQNPSLLPYFALPYITNPSTHPFLSRIYTPQWRSELSQQIQEIVGKKMEGEGAEGAEGEGEWFAVVKDLIGIARVFGSYVKREEGDGDLAMMLSRVQKYKEVIQNREKSHQVSLSETELNNLIYNPSLIQQPRRPELSLPIPTPPSPIPQPVLDKSMSQMSNSIFSPPLPLPLSPTQFNSLQQALYRLSSTKQSSNNFTICLLLHLLEIDHHQQSSLSRKSTISLYIQHDVFMLAGSGNQEKERNEGLVLGDRLQEIQCLKLLNTLCASHRFIRYIGASTEFVKLLGTILSAGVSIYLEPYYASHGVVQAKEERLLEAFAVLQKISFSRRTMENILNTDMPEAIMKQYLPNYKELPANILTYVLAVVLNILLNRQGKQKYSSPSWSPILLPQIVQIWEHISPKQSPSPPPMSSSKTSQNASGTYGEQNSHLQSLIYSIFYVLLNLQVNRDVAIKMGLPGLMQTFLEAHSDQYHQKVIGTILDLFEDGNHEEQPEMEQDSVDSTDTEEEEQQQQEEEDQTEPKREFLWIGDSAIEICLSEQPTIQQILSQVANPLPKHSFIYSKHPHNDVHAPKVTSSQHPQPARIMKNTSAPLSVKPANKIENRKEMKVDSQSVVIGGNGGETGRKYQPVEGYDPNKYAWKRVKTNKC